jgi:hypothetical protein
MNPVSDGSVVGARVGSPYWQHAADEHAIQAIWSIFGGPTIPRKVEREVLESPNLIPRPSGMDLPQ